jgi:carboxypeptidase C (cathepsin A)
MPVLIRQRYGLLALLLALGLGACGGGGGTPSATVPGGGQTATTDRAYTDPLNYSTDAGASLTTAVEAAAVTHHQLILGGKSWPYTATAGHLTATDPQTGKPEASFFYVAYTADGQAAATRPVTFFYNGGPGSATVWLHMGSFGPRRLVTGAPSAAPPVPFPMVDNQESLLDTTDLVFVDAVGTGYSEAVAPHRNQDFWGVDADAQVFRDFIERYLAVNQRAASPKFLFGESYGTLRSEVLADALEAAGVTLSGVVLQSSILNYNSNCGVLNPGQANCAGYLPSYGAIGNYFQLTNPVATDLSAFLLQLRQFAAVTYGPAVDAYLAPAHTSPAASVLVQLVAYTGASLSLWQSEFSLVPDTFQYNLLPGKLIGRYDARVVATKGTPLAADGDPSSTVIDGPFADAIRAYLPQFLQYNNASTYVLVGNAINFWDFSHDGKGLPDGIPDLATALAQNPKLRVLSIGGHHDLATPFYQTELDIARLGSGANITVKTYNGGHMTYLDDGSRPLEKADLAAFYAAAIGH